MPSVGSTPTTTSPAQHQTPPPPPIMTTPPPLPQPHRKLRQHSLPLHLQYQSSVRGGASHSSYTAAHHHSSAGGVRTTQPSPAGTFVAHHPQPHHHCTSSDYCGCGGAGPMANGGGIDDMDDLSPVSSSNSFSSVDTNQTLLNNIAAAASQQQSQPHQHKPSATTKERADSSSGGPTPLTHSQPGHNKRAAHATNRSYRTKYGQFMIITPAVSIDPDCANAGAGAAASTAERQQSQAPKPQKTKPGGFDDNGGGGAGDDDDPYFNNGNIFRMSLLQSSIDSGNSSDTSSFHSQYNPYIHTSRQHLLPKSGPHFYTFSSSSWRWCTLICAAMRCFGAGRSGGGGGSGAGQSSSTSAYNSFSRAPYQRSAKSTSAPHRRLKPSSSFTAETAFEHFSAPFKTRKTRDHLNNITYEL